MSFLERYQQFRDKQKFIERLKNHKKCQQQRLKRKQALTQRMEN